MRCVGRPVVRVARSSALSLVAQVPVRRAAAASAGKSRSPLRVEQVVHPDVVAGDVLRRLRRQRRAIAWFTSAGMRFAKRSARRASAHCRRVQLAPSRQALVERRQREVEQHDEGELVREEVVVTCAEGS